MLAHGDAQLGQPARGLRRELLAERRHDPVAGIDQDHASLGGVDPREFAASASSGEDRELARDLDSGRPAADDHEGQQFVAYGRIGGPLGFLEGRDDALPQRDASRSVFSPNEVSAHSSWPK